MANNDKPCAYTRDDGFGTRLLMDDEAFGPVEVLDLMPALTSPAAEQVIRARLDQLDGFGAPLLAPAYVIERKGAKLTVISAAVDGLPLCELLAALEFGTLTLPQDAILELAAMTVRAVGELHERLGPLSHGALNPAHVVLRRDGSVMLTDAIFGDALQQLERNREDMWRTFSLALPPSATVARFDRRTDVTQLGSIVLAILLRRTLLGHEYPRAIPDLVMVAAGENGAEGARVHPLRHWLQQALQLQARALFPSATEAAAAFADVLDSVNPRRAGAAVLQVAIRSLLGETVGYREPAQPASAGPGEPPAGIMDDHPEPRQAEPAPQRGFSFLRAVLPNLRAN